MSITIDETAFLVIWHHTIFYKILKFTQSPQKFLTKQITGKIFGGANQYHIQTSKDNHEKNLRRCTTLSVEPFLGYVRRNLPKSKKCNK